ncbi:MAG: hypothetical protein ABSE69_13150 [Roseiarcus sp.]
MIVHPSKPRKHGVARSLIGAGSFGSPVDDALASAASRPYSIPASNKPSRRAAPIV